VTIVDLRILCQRTRGTAIEHADEQLEAIVVAAALPKGRLGPPAGISLAVMPGQPNVPLKNRPA
jgi:hypothetical protein